MEAESSRKTREIGDEAIKAKTGKSREEWFILLDAAGATSLTHSAIAAYLHDEQGCPGWWSQMITVEYERARGMRAVNETPSGFQVSATRTFAAPISSVFEAWHNSRKRKSWLPDEVEVRKVNENKNIRLGWTDQKSSLDIRFYAKGDNKTQVTVDHSRLPDAASVDVIKAHWIAALDRLRAEVEQHA